jgi:hypothetical protein
MKNTATPQTTAWTEFLNGDASTDRGWLKAICEPYDSARCREYKHDNMPVWDDDIDAWREQCTLGNYLDYCPCRTNYSAESLARMYPDGNVHAVCYPAHTSRYFRTVAEAREWIETESARVRPELVFQRSLFAA